MSGLVALSQALGDALQQRGWQLVLAESCTGGLVAQSVTAIAGSSGWFDRGFVTYSNAAKSELLGVDADLITLHGAVSEPVAQAMAAGALAHSHGQLSGAITGIAGPGGGSSSKPVGMVCFGWATLTTSGEPACQSETVQFIGDRHQVRAQAAEHLLARLLALASV